MLKNDHERALKVYESAFNDLKLDTPEGELKHLYSGNQDLTALLVNYIKCNAIVKGGSGGLEFFKSDPLNQTLFTYLGKVNTQSLHEFLDERKKAENIFDEAAS